MYENDEMEMINQISAASSLQEIANLCFELFGNPVFMIDTANNVLAYSKNRTIDNTAWHSVEERNYFSKQRIWKSYEVRSVNADSLHKQQPVLVEDNYIPYPRLIKTIAARGCVRGTIVLTAFLKPFREKDTMMLNIIASFVFNLMDLNQSGENQTMLKGRFVELLNGEHVAAEQMENYLENYQFRQYKKYYILCIEFQNEVNPDDSSIEPIIRSFDRENCFMFLYDYALVCIYGTDSELSDWKKEERQLIDQLRHWELSAGISRSFSEIVLLRTHYMQARYARRIGSLLGKKGIIFCFDDYAYYALLQALPYSCHLPNYCNQKILALYQYDIKKKSELCRTLQIYLDNDKSLNRTAEIMYLNRNTIRYRVQKCMEFLNYDLEDYNTNFSFSISFRMLEFENRLKEVLARTESREFCDAIEY